MYLLHDLSAGRVSMIECIALQVKMESLNCGHLISALAGKARSSPGSGAAKQPVLEHLRGAQIRASDSALR